MTTEHDCIARINQQIADRNTQIQPVICLADPTRELILVATCKRDISKRGKPVSFFASFCPFCGKSLAKDDSAGVAGQQPKEI